MNRPNYEPWADLHKPQNFRRTDQTSRLIPLTVPKEHVLRDRIKGAVWMVAIFAFLFYLTK